jgi:SAM-dependent methyltransferase
MDNHRPATPGIDRVGWVCDDGKVDSVDLWNGEAQIFDDAADHGLHDPAVRSAWRQLLAAALPQPPCRIADLGCGTGTLTLLLAEQGHTVDGVDFAPEMVERARHKTSNHPAVSIHEADAFAPPLPAGAYDVVLCRHVLWMSPNPVEALNRWVGLLSRHGRLVIIEGHWSTGTGLTTDQTVAFVQATGRSAEARALSDPQLWGAPITDERYLVVSPPIDQPPPAQPESRSSPI